MPLSITDNDRYECLAALYAKRYGRLAPGKDDRIQDSGAPENLDQWKVWVSTKALRDAASRIVELEHELAAARSFMALRSITPGPNTPAIVVSSTPAGSGGTV